MVSRRCKYGAPPTQKLLKHDVTLPISTTSTLKVFCHYILKFFPTMSQSKSSTTDPCYRKTLSNLKDHPMLKLSSAMYLACFADEECGDRAIQMRVRRLIPSKQDPTIPSSVATTNPPDDTPKTNFSSVSSLTANDFSVSSRLSHSDELSQTILFPEPETSQERQTASAKQTKRAAHLAIKNYKKQAHN